MKRIFPFAFILLTAFAEPSPSFFELRIYRLKDDVGKARMDDYLGKALLPALHRLKINPVGVFEPAPEDTIHRNILLVLIPYSSFGEIDKINSALTSDAQLQKDASAFLQSEYNDPPYVRMQTILLKAFRLMPKLQTPGLKNDRSKRIYELRSYQSPTERLFRKKVQMFNEGGEIGLFKRLNFNAVFYSEVLSGPDMPNLMYMTSFEDKPDRDKHWDTFRNDPEWKTLSAKEEYKNTVSKIEIYFLRPTEYSDY